MMSAMNMSSQAVEEDEVPEEADSFEAEMNAKNESTTRRASVQVPMLRCEPPFCRRLSREGMALSRSRW